MFINSIIWNKNQGHHMSRQCMQTYDVLLYYGYNYLFTIGRTQYKKQGGTYLYHLKKYGKQAADERYSLGKELLNVWDIQSVVNKIYPTAKPYKLLKRVIQLSTV